MSEKVLVDREALLRIHRDLDACQKTIWLAGVRPRGYGFDPAYVEDAQARLKEIDALLAAAPAAPVVQAEQESSIFNGDNAALIRSAKSLLELDARGALAPHGIGEHACSIISAFVARMGAEQQPVAHVAITRAATDVLAERRRQIEAEGWAPEHDDEHDQGQLSAAAVSYAALACAETFTGELGDTPAPATWPWDQSWWKPAGPRRNLVKAGALILAEIERMDRASSGTEASHD